MLTPKQERFVAEYLVDLNGQQAAVRAGYRPRTARITASQLLTKPNIARAIAEAKVRRAERTQVTADRAVLEIARLAYADIREFFDERDRLRPVSELHDDHRPALASIEVVERRGKRGPGRVTKIRMWDKVRALELLLKHLGALKDHGSVDVKLTGDLKVIKPEDMTDEELDAAKTKLVEALALARRIVPPGG